MHLHCGAGGGFICRLKPQDKLRIPQRHVAVCGPFGMHPLLRLGDDPAGDLYLFFREPFVENRINGPQPVQKSCRFRKDQHRLVIQKIDPDGIMHRNIVPIHLDDLIRKLAEPFLEL